MDDYPIITFTITAAILTIVPGADTMLVISNVLRGGRRDGVLTALGICAGLFVHATLSALGISMVLKYSAAAFHLVKLLGAAYLIWLGLMSLVRALSMKPLADSSLGMVGADSNLRPTQAQCFREGFLTNVLNPKVAVFYLAFLPQFILPDEPFLAKSLLLAGIHCIEGIVWLSALSILLDRIRESLLKPLVRRSLEGLCGTVLMGLGIRLAFERQ